MLPMTAVFSSTGTYFLFNHSFRLVETSFLSDGNSIVLFRFFFSQWKLLLKFDKSRFVQTNHDPVSGHQFFQLPQRLFQGEAAILCSGNVFFNKLLIRLKEANFLASGNSFFFTAVFCQLKPVLELGETTFQRKRKRLFQRNSSFHLVETDFRGHNGFAIGGTLCLKKFIKKIRFHYAEKLLLPIKISKKPVVNIVQWQERGCFKKMVPPSFE